MEAIKLVNGVMYHNVKYLVRGQQLCIKSDPAACIPARHRPKRYTRTGTKGETVSRPNKKALTKELGHIKHEFQLN